MPRRRAASHLDPMAPGCLEPDASTFLSQFHCWRSFSKASDTEVEVDCHAQTSELGRLSIGKGGLPLWPLYCEEVRNRLNATASGWPRALPGEFHHFVIGESCGTSHIEGEIAKQVRVDQKLARRFKQIRVMSPNTQRAIVDRPADLYKTCGARGHCFFFGS